MVHVGKLLGKLQIHDGRPHPSSGPEPMDNVMEVDTGAYNSVNDNLYHLPEGFQKSDALGVCGTFRY